MHNLMKSKITKTAALGLSASLLTLGSYGVVKKLRGTLSSRNSMPLQFTVQERRLTVGTDFVVKDAQGCFATIDQLNFNLKPSFVYKDYKGDEICYAKQQILSWGVKINIYDNSDTLLGSVEEKIFSSFHKSMSSYSISDSSGKVVGQSNKFDAVSPIFSIKTVSGQPAAEISRSALDVGKATWSCNLSESCNIDPRLLVFIPAYKTHTDNKKSADSEASESTPKDTKSKTTH